MTGMNHTTYYSVEDLGLPHGALRGNNIYVAQDEYTRQYHKIDGKTFRKICDGSWKEDDVLVHAYTGNVGVIDTAGQIIGHSYDLKTPRAELENFDDFVGELILRRMKGQE